MIKLELTERQLDILNYAMLEYLYQFRKIAKEIHLEITEEELKKILVLIGDKQNETKS